MRKSHSYTTIKFKGNKGSYFKLQEEAFIDLPFYLTYSGRTNLDQSEVEITCYSQNSIILERTKLWLEKNNIPYEIVKERIPNDPII